MTFRLMRLACLNRIVLRTQNYRQDKLKKYRPMQLRDYQQTAVQSIFDYFNRDNGNPIVVMPTGTGKSAAIAGFIQQACLQYPATRIIMACHVKELVGNDFAKLIELWPQAPAGVYSAGLNRKELNSQITFGGIKSVANTIESFGHIDLFICDECHLISNNQSSTYIKTIRKLQEVNPRMKVVGFTATDYRMEQGKLTDDGEIFTDVCCDMATPEWFAWFIANNYIVRPVPRKTRTTIDTSKVGISNGEFNQGELQDASDRYEITLAAAQEAIQYGQMRRSWITFCSGIEHAEHAAEIFTQLGIETYAVHSKTDGKRRDDLIKAWQNGEIRNLSNNGILTTGIDNPLCDLVINLRATNSPALWIQMVGRGIRPSPGKVDCCVLDYARNTERLGTIDRPRIPRKKGEGAGEIPVKICEACDAYNHISARICDDCGAPFEIQIKFSEQADDTELMQAEGPNVEFFDVGNVVYQKHINRQTGNETIRVDYYCGQKKFNEYLSFDPTSKIAGRSRQWWKARVGDQFPTPNSNTLALGSITHAATKPKRLRVWLNKPGGYPEILQHEF